MTYSAKGLVDGDCCLLSLVGRRGRGKDRGSIGVGVGGGGRGKREEDKGKGQGKGKERGREKIASLSLCQRGSCAIVAEKIQLGKTTKRDAVSSQVHSSMCAKPHSMSQRRTPIQAHAAIRIPLSLPLLNRHTRNAMHSKQKTRKKEEWQALSIVLKKDLGMRQSWGGPGEGGLFFIFFDSPPPFRWIMFAMCATFALGASSCVCSTATNQLTRTKTCLAFVARRINVLDSPSQLIPNIETCTRA